MRYVQFVFFFFKQKTAYEMRISDWSSDVCSSDLDRIRKMFANQPLRIEIAHRDRQVPVGGKTAGGLGQTRRILEVNRLRHDDDPVPWELLDDTLPELLVNREIGRASGRERVCPYV